jgi:bifunctional isochorismate lyase/aryl carrier protein
MRDIRVFVASDGVADFSPMEHADALTWISHRCGVVLPSGALCETLATPWGAAGALRAEVAAVLEIAPGELAYDANLFDHGLDSIRLMSLVERWKPAPLGFIDFAETPTLVAWAALLKRT